MKAKLESINSGAKILLFFKKYFDLLPENNRVDTNTKIPLGDALMSAYAMFALKFPSALQFDDEARKKAQKHNLNSMFGINNIPSDTQMRSIVDDVPSSVFRGIYNELFRKIQRDKKLEAFEFLNIDGVPHYLLLVDGTEFFSSKKVHCKNCNIKIHKKMNKHGKMVETKVYYHQTLNAVIAHPSVKTVIPLMPEPIVKQDGAVKFDCEINALKRFLVKFREDHPKLKIVLVGDALFARGALIKLLKQYDIKFILNVKPGSHKTLFRIINTRDRLREVNHLNYEEEVGDKVKKKVLIKNRFKNLVPIDNQSSLELKVNFLEYWENKSWINTKNIECEEKKHFSWVTDISLNNDSIKTIMRGGRARWKIENEVFNTLKNHGYHYDHNFGHGNNNLANNFSILMTLSFYFDQVVEMCSKQFNKLLILCKRKTNIWEKFRFYYQEFLIDSWESLIEHLIKTTEDPLPFNTT